MARVDETLDVLAAHGLAGMVGILFIGLVAQVSWNGAADGIFYADAGTLGWQSLAALSAPIYAFGATYLILSGLKLLMPLRASASDEGLGLDILDHGEEAYSSGEGAILISEHDVRQEEIPVKL